MADAAASLGYAQRAQARASVSGDKRATPDYYTPPAFQRRNVGTPVGIEDSMEEIRGMLGSSMDYAARPNSYIIQVESNGKATVECLMNVCDSMGGEMREERVTHATRERAQGDRCIALETRLDFMWNSLNNVNPEHNAFRRSHCGTVYQDSTWL